MGQVIEVQCQQCGATTSQLDGPIMAGYLPRCVQCGRDKLVRWEDVLTSDNSTSTQTPDEQDARIAELAGPCSCGGTFAVDASVRCGDCRSADVEVTLVAIAD